MITRKNIRNTQVNDSFSQILTEAHEKLKSQHVSMLGSGIEEILSEEVLFEEYKESLLEGCTAEDAEVLSQLFNNTRDHILTEAQMEGMKPFSSMSFPMQRKAWPRVGVINAFPTEPTDLPKFSISFLQPYMTDKDGTRHYLPEALRADPATTIADRLAINVGAISTDGVPVDLFDLSGTGASVLAGDALDVDFRVTKVTFTDDGTGAPAEVDVNFKMDSASNMVKATVTAGTKTDTVIVLVDRRTGEVQATSFNQEIESIEVRAFFSSEANNSADSVGFDIDYKDLDVGTGRHIAAPLSTEWLQDMKAVYQIDGALKLVDIISDFLAQKLDTEALDHFETTYLDAQSAYGTSTFQRTFSVKPETRYAGSFKEWRSEIRTVIDHLASTIKDKSYHTSGSFNLIGNELDIDLITNVDWMFTADAGERSSVQVNYNMGAIAGSNKYQILSTPNNRQGVIRMLYIPNTADYTTVKYYPYAFNIENNNGYRDPNRPNLPAVVVNRRHIFDTIMPLVGKVVVEDNDGKLY